MMNSKKTNVSKCERQSFPIIYIKINRTQFVEFQKHMVL
jgi:hypothetical protein